MKTSKHAHRSELKQALHERIGQCASRGQYRRALEMLDHVIEDPLPLFQGEDWVLKERRLAWLHRIELLREWGKLTEVLAWACLEVEMDPQNVAAASKPTSAYRRPTLQLGRFVRLDYAHPQPHNQDT